MVRATHVLNMFRSEQERVTARRWGRLVFGVVLIGGVVLAAAAPALGLDSARAIEVSGLLAVAARLATSALGRLPAALGAWRLERASLVVPSVGFALMAPLAFVLVALRPRDPSAWITAMLTYLWPLLAIGALVVGERAARVVEQGPRPDRGPRARLAPRALLVGGGVTLLLLLMRVVWLPLVYFLWLPLIAVVVLMPWLPLIVVPWLQDRVVAREHAVLGELVLPPAVVRA